MRRAPLDGLAKLRRPLRSGDLGGHHGHTCRTIRAAASLSKSTPPSPKRSRLLLDGQFGSLGLPLLCRILVPPSRAWANEGSRKAARKRGSTPGGMGTKQRRAAAEKLASIPAEKPRGILATGSYIGEGFDDSRLDTLFTMPISWRGTLQQYVGRFHRTHDGKKVVQVYDYVDAGVPMLARMFEKRLKGYHAVGYELEGEPADEMACGG